MPFLNLTSYFTKSIVIVGIIGLALGVYVNFKEHQKLTAEIQRLETINLGLRTELDIARANLRSYKEQYEAKEREQSTVNELLEKCYNDLEVYESDMSLVDKIMEVVPTGDDTTEMVDGYTPVNDKVMRMGLDLVNQQYANLNQKD